jgi:TPR repeat protein
MRTFDLIGAGALLAAGIAGSALALDAKDSRSVVTAAPPASTSTNNQTSIQAFQAGTALLKSGDTDKAVTALRYAAEQGHPLAQWKLGRMYADGDGVKRDHVQAFQFFSRIANEQAEMSPWTQQARFVANAYVSLGHYYLTGIPNSSVQRDVSRAYGLISYAASYFGDADAQYLLARLYLEGTGVPKDARQGVRWLGLSANKGQHQAQALLGRMLFHGESVPKQRSRGLMWLSLGRDAAAGAEDGWIVQSYEDAFARANEDERASADTLAKNWLKEERTN